MTDELIGELVSEPRAGEKLLASACRFLSDGDEEELAKRLAMCSAQVVAKSDIGFSGETQVSLAIYITAPRLAYDVLTANDGDEWESDDRCRALFRAITAPIAPNVSRQIHVLAELIDPTDEWRKAYGATRPVETPIPSIAPTSMGGDDDIPF